MKKKQRRRQQELTMLYQEINRYKIVEAGVNLPPHMDLSAIL